MGAFLSIFHGEKYWASHERSLERIEQRIQRVNARWDTVNQHRRSVQRWALAVFIVSMSLALLHVSQLRRRTGLGHRDHLYAVLKALAIPCATEASRRFFILVFGTVLHLTSKQRRRLEASRASILKELKEVAAYDRLRKILLKYDPEERARAALASQAGSPLPTPVTGAKAGLLHHRATGGAVFEMVGKTMSPMVDKLASMLADDPTHEAAFRQLWDERDALQKHVQQLEERLSRYEDVGCSSLLDQGDRAHDAEQCQETQENVPPENASTNPSDDEPNSLLFQPRVVLHASKDAEQAGGILRQRQVGVTPEGSDLSSHGGQSEGNL